MPASPIPVTLSTTNLSQTCFATEQERLNAYIAATRGTVPAGYIQWIESSTKPAPSDQDKIWLKLNVSTGLGEGGFIFVAGSWTSIMPHPMIPGIIVDYVDAALNGLTFAQAKAAILLLDGGTALTPFWRICDGTDGTPNLCGRTTLAAGLGEPIATVAMTERIYGELVGEEEVSLIPNQIPNIAVSHYHPVGIKPNYGNWYDLFTRPFDVATTELTMQIGGDGGFQVISLPPANYVAPPNTGTPAPPFGAATLPGVQIASPVDVDPGYPHDNMQPNYVTYKMQRTALKYLVIP